jgi:hypothetical protein
MKNVQIQTQQHKHQIRKDFKQKKKKQGFVCNQA